MTAEQAPALSILVPVYNGAKTIRHLVDEVSRLELGVAFEVVLVNDGSADDSAEVCADIARTASIPVTYVEHSRNFGEHNAVMTGLKYCRGDYIITMDDDLQNPPSEIAKLFRHTREQGLDVVYTFYGEKKDSAFRNLGSRFANWTAGLVIDKPKGLYLSSFRCFTRFVAREVGHYEGPYPYVDGLILQVTQRVGSIQVEHLPRANDRSNYTLRKLIRLWLSLLLNFSVVPLRLATVLGLFFGAASAIGGVYTLIDYMFYGAEAKGWISLILAVLLFSSVQLVMLGIVGEYIGRQYLAVNRKPQGIVREVVRNTADEG